MAPGEMLCFINDLERSEARVERIAERSEHRDPGTAPVSLFLATLNRSAADEDVAMFDGHG